MSQDMPTHMVGTSAAGAPALPPLLFPALPWRPQPPVLQLTLLRRVTQKAAENRNTGTTT
jgi:hypothetical protein